MKWMKWMTRTNIKVWEGADNHESLDSIPDQVIAAHVLKRMTAKLTTESLLQRLMFVY